MDDSAWFLAKECKCNVPLYYNLVCIGKILLPLFTRFGLEQPAAQVPGCFTKLDPSGVSAYLNNNWRLVVTS